MGEGEGGGEGEGEGEGEGDEPFRTANKSRQVFGASWRTLNSKCYSNKFKKQPDRP